MKGDTYVAAPHTIETTKILRTLGYAAPAPIHHYYSWPGRFAPFAAQKQAAGFLTLHDRAFNLSELGTGKSLAALWAYDYLRSCGLVHKALVVSPLSTLERTWADEVFQHFPHLETSVLHGTKAKRVKMLNQDADIYIVNHDGVKILEPYLKDRPDIDLVIVDEIAQAARNAGTDRWKAINNVVNRQGVRRACWGLTGTPTPNAPTDAWAQCRIVVPQNVPPYFNRFKGQVMRRVSQFSWVPKKGATAVVHNAMKPAIRFTRDECVDLPPILFETRNVQLTKDQSTAYKDMLTKLRAEASEGQITAANEAVKLSKLVQIACGAAYSDDGGTVSIDASPRVQEVRSIIRSAEGKVIVFVPFVSSVEALAATLSKDFTTEVIYGAVKKSERDRILSAFQREEDPKVLVAQPAAMSHGLTLTAASTIVWYSCITSNETFEQANGRINRPGQKMKNFVIMLEGTPVERRVYQRLQNKQKMQGALLAEVRADRDAVVG